MSKYSIFALPGDGIGAEVMAPALTVAQAAAEHVGVELEVSEGLVGGVAIDATGQPLPDETLNRAKEAHAVLLGGVGGPKWDDLPTAQRPEKGLLGLRQGLGLFANLLLTPVFEVRYFHYQVRIDVISGSLVSHYDRTRN